MWLDGSRVGQGKMNSHSGESLMEQPGVAHATYWVQVWLHTEQITEEERGSWVGEAVLGGWNGSGMWDPSPRGQSQSEGSVASEWL